jgi:two-component system response regulator AlgR
MIPRIFIVDDEAPARSRLMTLLADIAADCPHRLVGEAANARQALDAIATLRPDIVLLDIRMPGMSGMDLAAELGRVMTPAPMIVFTTAYDAYALKAFEVQAVDYLLKPVRAERLAAALRRAAALCAPALAQPVAIHSAGAVVHDRRRHFTVQERGRLLLIAVRDVIYLKAELKYVTLRTRTGEYLIEASLTSIEDELGDLFVRVHRSALVARGAIAGVERASAAGAEADGEGDRQSESWQVILHDVDERLPVSRRQWPVVKALVK